MKKRITIIIILALIAAALGGCSLMDSIVDTPEDPITSGTTAGNILNGGFGVKDGDDLVFVYTSGGAYEYGSFVRSNPETGENSLVMGDGGLYMNLSSGVLYYCRPDGIYKAKLSDPQPEKVVEGKAELLQVSGDAMYYVTDGVILSSSLDGKTTDFEPVIGADNLVVAEEEIYYMDAESGAVFMCDSDGGSKSEVFAGPVEMFAISGGKLYYIDAGNGHLMRTALDGENETVVAARCSGFNVNLGGIYYTRVIEGKSVCCSADTDGAQEQVIEDFGESAWHVSCMWGEGAIVLPVESLSGMK